jgi:Transposase DDE domain group 1
VRSLSRSIDRFRTIFDHGGLVANAGLIVPATLMDRLGLEDLIDDHVDTGSSRPGRKILTIVAAIIAGATHIDHVDMLRAGATERVLSFRPMAASTVGTFLRTFTFGHVRQLDAVASRALQRAWQAGAGPGTEPVVIDLDSTICEVHGKQKQGTGYGYTGVLGYHPLLATLASTGEILFARMRHGSANTARGAVRFVDELVAVARRAGATGPVTMRADSGFWAWNSSTVSTPTTSPGRSPFACTST